MIPLELHTDSLNIYDNCDLLQFTRMLLQRDNVRTGSKHMHSHYELYFLLDGEVDFAVEETCKHLCAGEIVLARGGEYHNTLRVEPKRYDHCFFYFSDKSFPAFAGGTASPIDYFREHQSGNNSFLKPDKKTWERIISLLERLTELVKETEKHPDLDFNNLTKYAIVLELFGIVANCFRRAFLEQTDIVIDQSNLNPIANRAVHYIDLNFRTIGEVNEIAAACSVSHPHLSRTFKSCLGISPGEYLRTKRIAYAKLLLLNGYNVTSTCYYSGFKDYSYFIQAFKSAEGVTPLAFQEAHQTGKSFENNIPD